MRSAYVRNVLVDAVFSGIRTIHQCTHILQIFFIPAVCPCQRIDVIAMSRSSLVKKQNTHGKV